LLLAPAAAVCPPQGVDYLGLDPSRQLLLFAASSPDVLRDIKLPLAAVQQVGSVQLHSDLQDQHLYVMSRWGSRELCYTTGTRPFPSQ
jgi:hypothetical protein